MYLANMNKPKATDNLIPVRDYAKTYINRRGLPVTVQYIYKLIALNKTEGKTLRFDYVEDGNQIWIKK
jgi:hypothetical protein